MTGQWGCVTEWDHIFMTRLIAMGLHFPNSYLNGVDPTFFGSWRKRNFGRSLVSSHGSLRIT